MAKNVLRDIQTGKEYSKKVAVLGNVNAMNYYASVKIEGYPNYDSKMEVTRYYKMAIDEEKDIATIFKYIHTIKKEQKDIIFLEIIIFNKAMKKTMQKLYLNMLTG